MKEYKISWRYIEKLIEKLTGDDISGMEVTDIAWTPDEEGRPLNLIIRVEESYDNSIEFIPEDYDEEYEDGDEEELEEEEL